MAVGTNMFSKRMDQIPSNNDSQLRIVIIIFIVAVALSYPWELAQSPLYTDGNNFSRMWWHCLIASLGDGLIMLFILLIGWITFHHSTWFKHPATGGYILMFVLCTVINVSFELLMLRFGFMSYTSRMPILPGLRIGVAPFLFNFVLPPLIFRASAIWLNYISSKTSGGTLSNN